MDALRNKFKRTPVEFEPQLNTRCTGVTCIPEANTSELGWVILIPAFCSRTSFFFLISHTKIKNEMKVEDGFRQSPPIEGHPFLDDPILPALLHRLCPPE